jgi:hypothetical protein
MSFRPNQFPRTIFAGELAADLVGAIMIQQPVVQIARLTYVKFASGILENVNPIHGNEIRLAPEVGLEPTTHRLTADCSTIELLWNPKGNKSTNRRTARQTDSTRFPALHPRWHCGQ